MQEHLRDCAAVNKYCLDECWNWIVQPELRYHFSILLHLDIWSGFKASFTGDIDWTYKTTAAVVRRTLGNGTMDNRPRILPHLSLNSWNCCDIFSHAFKEDGPWNLGMLHDPRKNNCNEKKAIHLVGIIVDDSFRPGMAECRDKTEKGKSIYVIQTTEFGFDRV